MTDSKPPEYRDEKERQEWYERTRYQILLFAVGIALFGLILGLILDWYIDPHTSTQKKDLVQALGLITAGVAGAVGIFFTWRGQERGQRNTQEQFRLTRQSQEQNQQSIQAQLENAQEELQLTRQGQITERFTRAIDQLGSEKLEVRLGGIYALERIDKESPERAYHPTVMEVLTAYVRENSRREPRDSADKYGAPHGPGIRIRLLPTEIVIILDVLTRRMEERVPEEHRVVLNLRQAYLAQADLEGAYLQGAILQQAMLEGAYLQEANLQEAVLEGAILRLAGFQGADLQQANLRVANLQGAFLEEADLRRANLMGADLQGAELQLANFQGAHGITEEQLEWTIGLFDETLLDEALNPPELWSKSIDEQYTIIREHFGGR